MAAPGPQSVDGFTRLDELTVERRPVFVRADLDVAIDGAGTVQDDTKLVRAVPTLRRLLDAEAQVVVGAHRSLPATDDGNAGVTPAGTLEPIAARLAELLDAEVYLPDRSTGLLARKLKNELRPGRLLLLENLLLDSRESSGDASLARELAEGIEVFVGDCLSGPHTLTSLGVLPRMVHERAVGLRLEQELVAANRLRHAFGQGLVLLLGGRFSERRALLEHAAQRAGSTLLAVGELAETLAHAQRSAPDASDRDASEQAQARSWLQKASSRGLTIELARSNDEATRASERLSAARCTLLVGVGSASDPTKLLLEASVRGAGLLVVVHDPQLPMDDFATQTGKSRSVFVSTAGAAFEALVCEQKLAGVESLRRAP